MASEARRLWISREDYLAGELMAHRKHEYVAGQVYAMAGGSANHQRVALAFSRMCGNGLAGKPCEPFGSDFLIRVSFSAHDEAFYYPDGMIVCEPVGGSDRYTDSPVVILEVLSESTRRNDEVQKLRDYFTLPSLQVYLLAESNEPVVRVYRRGEEGFKLSLVEGLEETIPLPEVDLELAMAELYRDVDFQAEEEDGVGDDLVAPGRKKAGP
jgi:Uma2 family endonuclease